ncbi:MAG: PAS domain S-box protein [Candidatus Omnitrophota bacterium]|jgi:PAS domain S-box-containing protein|nr:MAG: PAS domain S-box protein [Candidatus Omnitrophota bacterium]
MTASINYNEFWVSLFDTMDDIIFIVDKECNIKKANSAFLLAMNSEEKNFIDKKCYDVLGSCCCGVNSCPHKETVNAAKLTTSEYYDDRLNKWFHLRSAPLFDKNNAVCGSICVLIDITEHKAKDEELEELSQAVELSPTCVMITDADANIEYVNKKFLQLTGYALEEVIGKNPRILNSGEQDKEFYKKLWDTILSGEEWRGQFHNRKKNGQLYWESALISSVKNKDGKIIHFIAVKEDITERKKMEESLLAANERLKELDKLKSEFVATVSHELRTPLSIMKEGVSLVIDKVTGPLNGRQEKTLETVFSNIDRLTQLINDLLDISRIESGKLRLKKSFINVSALLDDTCSKMRIQSDSKHQQLLCYIPDKPEYLFVDQDKFIQILTNIISNAVKYTPENGIITVSLQGKDESVEFRVIDNGSGISREDLPKLFGKFAQFGRSPGAGPKGTGLGLAITKELVNMHKGSIWVESDLGKGSKFVISLPRIECIDIFKESAGKLIDDALKEDKPITFILLQIDNSNEIISKYGFAEFNLVLRNIESEINKALRGKEDVVQVGKNEIIISLFGVGKDTSGIVYGRIENIIREYILKSGLQSAKELKTKAVFISYPEETKNIEELLAKVSCSSVKNE